MYVQINIKELANILAKNKSEELKCFEEEKIKEYYEFYYNQINKVGVIATSKDYLKDLLVEQSYYVNNEMLFSMFDEKKYKNNIDFIDHNQGGNEEYNIGFEKGKRNTILELIEHIDSFVHPTDCNTTKCKVCGSDELDITCDPLYSSEVCMNCGYSYFEQGNQEIEHFPEFKKITTHN